MRCFIAFCLFLWTSGVFAGEIVLSGVYQGKDPFVYNPYLPASNANCTMKVFVNDRLVLSNPQASAYKIDLSYLSLKDLVVIRILYHDGCTPRVVNPHVLRPISGFQFLFARADMQSINWLVNGELRGAIFYLEQYIDGAWKVKETVTGKGGPGNTEYNLAPSHHKGVNRYRVKYTPASGESVYSLEFDFDTEAELRPLTYDDEYEQDPEDN